MMFSNSSTSDSEDGSFMSNDSIQDDADKVPVSPDFNFFWQFAISDSSKPHDPGVTSVVTV